MARIQLDGNLYERAKAAAQAAGYSSVEEFVAHCVERELEHIEARTAEDNVSDQLRGLGYLE